MATGDMRGKYEAVKGKLVTYKNLKKELDEIQNEVLVLSRTQVGHHPYPGTQLGERTQRCVFTTLGSERNHTARAPSPHLGPSRVCVWAQAVLEEKAGVVAQAVSEEEKSKGVAGFAHTAQTLEHVSNQKGQIDEAKGATLEKISSLVTEINQVRPQCET
jgi:hypothetical protein